MPRVQIKAAPPPAANRIQTWDYIPSGSTLLDCVLGGGWGQGRIANIVGDKSSGKTLLAIEACANFARKYPAEHIRYAEAEAAFDSNYAQSIGMPKAASMSEDGEIHTVEDFHNDLLKWLTIERRGAPCLYVLDSLDALSDSAEMGREFGTATYGTGKAKDMSELFRRDVSVIRDARCTLLIISQIRDKIGVTFGETKTRSGGRALDFYASQIVWLSEIQKLDRTISKVKRIVGVRVLARNKKNKLGRPFRDAEFSILFNYGVDDETSMCDWLVKNKGEELLSAPPDAMLKQIKEARVSGDRNATRIFSAELRMAVEARWEEIESALTPPMSKYGA